MDTAMCQLRLFVHQRLYTAAEDILREVEKNITLALCETEVGRSKEEVESLRHQLDLQRKKPAAEPSLTNSTVEQGDKFDAPLLQENPGPSTPEVSNYSLSTEVQGPCQTSADLDNNWNSCLVQTDCEMSEIKEEQEELGVDSQTHEMVFPFPEIVKSEQDQPETQESYEMQPAISVDCSGDQIENNDRDTEFVKRKGKKTKTRKRKILQGQSGNVNEKDQAALPHDKSSAQIEKGHTFCHFCGKGFRYLTSLMKHVKTHEMEFVCNVCGIKCQSTKQLITHLKSLHNSTCVCDTCGRTFAKIGFLRTHERKHKAAEPSLTSSTEEHGDECDASLLQENPGPSAPEESNFSLSAEVPGPSQSSTDLDIDCNYSLIETDIKISEIIGGQEELGDNSQTQEMFFPTPEIVNSEQSQPESQVSYELQPISSDCSAAQSENNDSDEEWMNSIEEEIMKLNGKILQGKSGSVNEKDQAALPHDKSSAKSEKGRSFCNFCGKGFHYIGALMKHINTHKNNFDCSVCWQTYQSTKELITHVKSCHNQLHFCNVCGKTFSKRRFFLSHQKMHTEFVCQECGKTFDRREHLIVHVRTHSG